MFLYAVFVFGRSVAFSGHCGRCFRFGIAVCALLFALVRSVTGQILSMLRFVCGGSILYRVIFACLKSCLNRAITIYQCFYILSHFLQPFFDILRFFGQRSAQKVGFFFRHLL